MPGYPDGAEAASAAGKRELRGTLLAARRTRPAHARRRAAARVQAVLTDLVRRRRPACVAAYVPVGAEPGGADLPEVLAAALPPSGRLLLPVLRADFDLDWAAYAGPAALAAGARGLREPTGARLGTGAVRDADLVVVPALAVDRHGMRMGRGGGSYDRALARVGPAALTVALLHDGELLPVVPAEPHDRPVRAAITPADGLVLLDVR